MEDHSVSFSKTASLKYDRQYFDFLREKWKSKKTLRILYNHWFKKLVAHIPADHKIFEIGGGAGNFKDFYPKVVSSDILPLPWLDCCFNATESIPIDPSLTKTIVFIDIYHHISNASGLFKEINRVTKPGDRIIFLEPYVSFLSYPFYACLHHEPVSFNDKPLFRKEMQMEFANSAAAQLTFKGRDFRRLFPDLKIIHTEFLASLEYALSGGFNYPSLYPSFFTRILLTISDFVCRHLGRIFSFRMLVVMEKM